jgi:hypothetical protein
VAREKGRILPEAWAMPDLRVFSLKLLMSRVNSPEARVEFYLEYLKCVFREKMGPFFGGNTPRSSP